VAKKNPRMKPGSRAIPFAAAGAGGAGMGYVLGHIAARSGTAAMVTLAEGILSQAALATVAPIVGTAIVGASAVCCAIVIPATVVWAISRHERNINDKEKDETHSRQV
jgi:hypothetical protein